MAKKIKNDIEEEEKKVSKSRKTSAKSTKEELVPATKAKKSKAKEEDKKTESKSSKKATTKKVASDDKEDTKTAKISSKDDKVETKATKETKKTSTKKVDKPTSKTDDEPALRYSDEDLAVFTKVINDARDEAIDELRMLKDRLDDLTSFDSGEESMIYSMHMAEQGSEAQEKEKTYAQIQRIGEHIKKLDDAMERIKDKTYGICRVCGCLIAKERLMAVPITTLSASFKIHSKCPEDGIDRIEPVKF